MHTDSDNPANAPMENRYDNVPPSPPFGSCWSTVRSCIRVRPGTVPRTFFMKRAGRAGAAAFRAGAGRQWPAAPPPVAANIHRFLTVIQARKRWTGYFGAAFAPDSNLNAASENEIIYIDTVFGRLPFTREGDFGAKSGLGVSVWGGGEYQQPLSERLRLRVGADLAQREYSGSNFDQLFLAAHTGPRWLASPITEISLLATAQRQWLGGLPYVDETGVRLELDRRLTSRIWARGTVAHRELDHQQRDFLDGPVVEFTASFVWTPAPVLQVHATVGTRANMLSWSTGTACRAGCAWARRSPCRWASLWAPVPRCGARITRAAGSRTLR